MGQFLLCALSRDRRLFRLRVGGVILKLGWQLRRTILMGQMRMKYENRLSGGDEKWCLLVIMERSKRQLKKMSISMPPPWVTEVECFFLLNPQLKWFEV